MRRYVGGFLAGIILASGVTAAQLGVWVTQGTSAQLRTVTGGSNPAVVIRQDGTGPIFELRGSDGVSVFSIAEDGTCTGAGCGGGGGDLSEADIDTSAEIAAIVGDETAAGGGALVFNDTPTLITPVIASFTNAQHTHANAAGGGTLNASVITAGTIGHARLGSGGGGATKFLREDSTYQTIGGGGDALVANPLSQFAATTSAQLAGVISNETGSDGLVFATNPTLAVPLLNGFRRAYAAKTADYTVATSDLLLTCDATGTSLQVDFALPTAASVSGREYVFKRIDTDTDGSCVLDGDGAETVEGAATYAIAIGESVSISSNGTNWIVTAASAYALADPGADRITFWDDSAGHVEWLTVGTGLTLSSTTLSFDSAATLTYTNATINAESTGNVITLPLQIQFNTAVCQNAAASAGGSAPTSLGAAASCSGTTPGSGDPAYGFIVFPTGGADTEWHDHFELPADWTGAVDVKLIWKSGSTTTNNVVWEIAFGCTADGEVPTGVSLNETAFDAVANNNVADERNSATKTGITTTGCSAGETAYFVIHRDTDTAGDTLDADVHLMSVVFTIRRAI